MSTVAAREVRDPAGRRLEPRRRGAKVSGSDVLTYVVLVVLAFGFLLPLIWMISSSLKPEAEVLQIPPTFVPSDPQWGNYGTVFEIIPQFFWNSTKLAALNVGGVLVTSALAGYAFGRMDFAGRNLAFAVLLATAIIPSVVYLLPQYIMFVRIGWIDTHYPLWVPKVFTPVFATFLMRQYFMSLPKDLEDAARVDGAGTFTTFWRIMLPQTKPAAAAIATFTFLESWNDLFGPIIFLNSPELQTLPVALAQFRGEFFTQISILMAAAAITVLPVLLVFIFAQRYFIQGVTMSGLRG